MKKVNKVPCKHCPHFKKDHNDMMCEVCFNNYIRAMQSTFKYHIYEPDNLKYLEDLNGKE